MTMLHNLHNHSQPPFVFYLILAAECHCKCNNAMYLLLKVWLDTFIY